MNKEFHTIIEYSFHAKKEFCIVRFLDGTCLKVLLEHLPVKFKSTKSIWKDAEVTDDKKSLTVPMKKGRSLSVPAHILYSSGQKI